jgi:phytoene dehydrogenase-like protein
MTAKLKVAIIGAGMGGLTAAAILARKGIQADV